MKQWLLNNKQWNIEKFIKHKRKFCHLKNKVCDNSIQSLGEDNGNFDVEPDKSKQCDLERNKICWVNSKIQISIHIKYLLQYYAYSYSCLNSICYWLNNISVITKIQRCPTYREFVRINGICTKILGIRGGIANLYNPWNTCPRW